MLDECIVSQSADGNRLKMVNGERDFAQRWKRDQIVVMNVANAIATVVDNDEMIQLAFFRNTERNVAQPVRRNVKHL